MKIHKWVGILVVSLMVMGNSIEAATITDQVGQMVITEDEYIDVSSYSFTYKQIPGFLVSPLQVAGELLAPFNQTRSGYSHEGIDIRAEIGTPVFAIADGIVTKAAPDSKGVENGGGHMIFVDFGNGVEGRYMHLSAYAVKAGDEVKAGQVIGLTGNSGDSTTPHLHFEYRIGDMPVDPAFIFEASGMVQNQVVTNIGEVKNYTSNWQKERFSIEQQ